MRNNKYRCKITINDIVMEIKNISEKRKASKRSYTTTYCPSCLSATVIYAKGTTACIHCGCILLPCECCESCDYLGCWNTCPYGPPDEPLVTATNPPITAKEVARYSRKQKIKATFAKIAEFIRHPLRKWKNRYRFEDELPF